MNTSVQLTKIKTFLVTSLIYFLYLFSACFLVMLIESFLVFVLNKLVVLTYFSLTVIRVVVYTPCVIALVGVFGYAEGYKEEYFSVKDIVLPYLPAAILHLLFAMLFKFQPFVAGSVRFTAGLIANGTDITYDSLLNQTTYATFLWVFFAYSVVYCLTLLIAKYFGMQKRIMVRGEIRKHEK